MGQPGGSAAFCLPGTPSPGTLQKQCVFERGSDLNLVPRRHLNETFLGNYSNRESFKGFAFQSLLSYRQGRADQSTTSEMTEVGGGASGAP